MKGKVYKYDSASQKMIPVTDANLIPLLEGETQDGIKVGFGLIEIPRQEKPELSEQQRNNLKSVLRMTDQEAEKMDRRDCVRVQEQVAKMREQYGIEE
jgi:hypothetical protein